MRSSILKLAVVAAIGFSGLVHADTITQTVSFSLSDSTTTPGSTEGSLVFDQFDPLLGSLTTVLIRLGSPSTHVDYSMFSVGMGDSSYQDAVVITTVTFPGGTPFPFPTGPFAQTCIKFDGTDCIHAEVHTSDFSLSTQYPTSFVGPFIGTGNIGLDLSVLATVTPLCDTCIVKGTANWSGDAVMTYVYNPAAPSQSVPEPSSIFLAGTGISYVIARRRRPSAVRL
jgi:hypothetical protein